MAEHKPQITASSIETFNSISEAIAKLPPRIFEQIERAEMGLTGIKCHIRKFYEEAPKVFLPKDTTQITFFDDFIGVYTKDFFFQLPDTKAKYTYLFI